MFYRHFLLSIGYDKTDILVCLSIQMLALQSKETRKLLFTWPTLKVK